MGGRRARRDGQQHDNYEDALHFEILFCLRTLRRASLARALTLTAVNANMPARRNIKMNTKNLSLEELREMAELTNTIAANLKVINEDKNDLEEMVKQTDTIVGNLNVIDENDTDRE
jgi:hypothetical protein